MQSVIERLTVSEELEAIRSQKKAELLIRHADEHFPMFTDEQKALILEFQWLEKARTNFLHEGSVYLWRAMPEETARDIAHEQRCPAVFLSDNRVIKVMLPEDLGPKSCYLLDEILLALPIDVFQNQASTRQVVGELFPTGFASKGFYYQPSYSMTSLSVFKKETPFSLDIVKERLRESGCVYPSTLARLEAERMISTSSGFLLRESTSQVGEIALTFYDAAKKKYQHILLDQAFVTFLVKKQAQEDILSGLKIYLGKPDAHVFVPSAACASEVSPS